MMRIGYSSHSFCGRSVRVVSAGLEQLSSPSSSTTHAAGATWATPLRDFHHHGGGGGLCAIGATRHLLQQSQQNTGSSSKHNPLIAFPSRSVGDGSSRSSIAAKKGLKSYGVPTLPKVAQVQGGRSSHWNTAKEKFGRGLDISDPLEDTRRTEAHRKRVAGWTPVVKVSRDTRLRVAIVGRMNSGKSSLFNLLKTDLSLGSQRNLVKNVEGLTRDCIECFAQLSGLGEDEVDTTGSASTGGGAWMNHRQLTKRKPYTIIDTPGFINGVLVEEAMRTITTADVVMFVTSVDEPLTDEEKHLARVISARKQPTFLIVNKVDLLDPEDISGVLNSIERHLGLGKAIPISARAQDGLAMIKACLEPFYHFHQMQQTENDWDMEDLAREGDEDSIAEIRERNCADRRIRVAIIGRSNAGKSSLLNRLVGFERSRVSDEINTTRDPLEISCTYKGRKIQLIDSAGMVRTRYKSKYEFIGKLHAATVNAMRFAHVCIVAFDATEGHPNSYDMVIMHRVASEGRPFLLCCNKWDLVLDPTATAEAVDYKIKRQMREVKYSNAVVVSAHTGQNLELLMDQVLTVYDTWNKKIPAKDLTRFWRKMEKSVVIPRHYTRIFRIVQTNTRPPTFALKLQSKDQDTMLADALVEMVKNAIVEEFGFQGVPIRVFQDTKKDAEYI